MSLELEVFICIISGLHNHRFPVAFLKMERWLTNACFREPPQSLRGLRPIVS